MENNDFFNNMTIIFLMFIFLLSVISIYFIVCSYNKTILLKDKNNNINNLKNIKDLDNSNIVNNNINKNIKKNLFPNNIRISLQLFVAFAYVEKDDKYLKSIYLKAINEFFNNLKNLNDHITEQIKITNIDMVQKLNELNEDKRKITDICEKILEANLFNKYINIAMTKDFLSDMANILEKENLFPIIQNFFSLSMKKNISLQDTLHTSYDGFVLNNISKVILKEAFKSLKNKGININKYKKIKTYCEYFDEKYSYNFKHTIFYNLFPVPKD